MSFQLYRHRELAQLAEGRKNDFKTKEEASAVLDAIVTRQIQQARGRFPDEAFTDGWEISDGVPKPKQLEARGR